MEYLRYLYRYYQHVHFFKDINRDLFSRSVFITGPDDYNTPSQFSMIFKSSVHNVYNEKLMPDIFKF